MPFQRYLISAALLAILTLCGTVGAQYADNFPRVILPYENAVCRITIDDRDGGQSHGSGVLIEAPAPYTDDGRVYVFTAYHILNLRRSKDSITVTWNGVDKYPATVIASRPGCDASVLLVTGAPDTSSPGIPLATQDIQPGETVYGFGFGLRVGQGANTLRCSGGPVLDLNFNDHRDPVWYTFAGAFRDGDSGGPVFVVRDGKPQLIGCLWGSNYDTEYKHWTGTGTRLTVIRRLFRLETAPVNKMTGSRYSSPVYTRRPVRQGSS